MVNSFVIPCTVARHAPLSMGFSRQEYWGGLPFPSPTVHGAAIEPEATQRLSNSQETTATGAQCLHAVSFTFNVADSTHFQGYLGQHLFSHMH